MSARSKRSNSRKTGATNSGADDKRGYVRVSGTTLAMVKDPEQLQDWDDEELERGRRRDKNGNFQGNPPAIVPMACYRELNKRRMHRASQMMSEALEPALKELRAIIDSPLSEDKDKLKAIGMILERVLGKTPDRVEISDKTPPWLQALQDGIVAVPPSEKQEEDDDDDITDAEIVWDSEEEAG